MSAEIAQSALWKVRWRLIPFLFVLYIVAYLDRVNVGFAAIDMNRDLGFTPATGHQPLAGRLRTARRAPKVSDHLPAKRGYLPGPWPG